MPRGARTIAETTTPGRPKLHEELLRPFFEEGYIAAVIRQISAGKEASIWLCAAGEFAGERDLVAVKAYRERTHRDFQNRAVYTAGRVVLDERAARAMSGKTRFGRSVEEGLWQGREWEVLKDLHAAGVPVPEPIAFTGDAMLLSYIGDEGGPAPQLRQLRPDRQEADELWNQVLRAVESMLLANVVHADLSPYNILAWEENLTLIDFPQAVDPRFNPNAFELLERDLRNVGGWFAKHGVDNDPGELAQNLWTAWEFADLIPGDLR